MAQSLFICLKQLHPDSHIDVLAPEWCRALLDRMPEVRESLVMPVGHGALQLRLRRRLGKELRARHYDQAIVLPNSFKSALVPWFAGIPQRTGWRGEMRGWILNDCRVLDKQAYPMMVQRFAALAFPPSAPLPIDLPHPALRHDAAQARLLREQGFAGRIRATGGLIADQYAMARRVGIDEVQISAELARRQPQDQWLARADWQDWDHRSRLAG